MCYRTQGEQRISMTQGAQDRTEGGVEGGRDKLGKPTPAEPRTDSEGVETTEEGIRG